MANWLKDNYVILTGAAGGIGKALTKILISTYGAKVIGIGRTESKLQALQAELGENAHAFSYFTFDVSVKENWPIFRAQLEEQNIRPVLLINNAGIFPAFNKALNSEEDVLPRVMQTNFYSAVYAIRALSPILVGVGKIKPAIYNISSSAALCSVVGTAAYSASKAALKGYTEALQLEERDRLHVGVIFPGMTKTELFRDEKNMENSILDAFSVSAEKMGNSIARAIYQRKYHAVIGLDANLMNTVAKVAPANGLALVRWVMKTSKNKVFSQVFDFEKEEIKE